MNQIERYAVFYAPRQGAFAGAVARWLGWDPATGRDVAHPEVAGLSAPVADITAAPRRYGFHGTLKPPFRLAAEVTPDGLQAACADLAAGLAPVVFSGLRVERFGGFVALLPEGDTTALEALAARVVPELDAFRAPLSDAEIARRRPDRLSLRQRALLDQWGYPYVMEEFRFHLTLTGDLGPGPADTTAAVLADHLAPVLPAPFVIGDICLFGEDEAGRFHILHRYPLSG